MPTKTAPSRGTAAGHITESSDDVAVSQQSNSALINARRNFNYLINPTSSGTDKPTRFRTRALLRTLRYIGQFIIWRLVRWAKYAAVAAATAAVGATLFGTTVTGVGWVLAPPSIGASIIAMSVWGVGKFAARRLHDSWKATGEDAGVEFRERATDEGETTRAAGRGMGPERGPAAVPW